MKSINNNKGITLIALIITIIVMLILVAVTISVALNGGLFERAQKAKEQSQLQLDKEELVSAASAAVNPHTGIVDATKLSNGLRDGWIISENEENNEVVSYTCISPNGNEFTVNTRGMITYVGASSEGGGNVTPVEPEEPEEPEEPVTPTAWSIDSTTGKYTNGVKSYAKFDIITKTELSEDLGINVTGSYTGDWQVIGLDGSNLKLVSTGNVGNCMLGYKDNVANTPKTTEYYNSMTMEDEPEAKTRGINSYKRAETTLNEVAQTGTGLSNAVSVDIQDIYELIGGELSAETIHAFGNTNDSYGQGFEYSSGEFLVNGERVSATNSNKIPVISNYFKYSFTSDDIGSLATGDSYFLATQVVKCTNSSASYLVRYMNLQWGNMTLLGEECFRSSSGFQVPSEHGVRAVIFV